MDRALFEEGLSAAKTAEKFGFTKSAVTRHRAAMLVKIEYQREMFSRRI